MSKVENRYHRNKSILQFILRSAPRLLLLSIASSVLAGLSTVGLIAITIHAITKGSGETKFFWLAFFSLCFIVVAARFASLLFVLRLSHDVLFQLRVGLASDILATPLQRLEEIGVARLMATLNEDAAVVSESLPRFVFVCVNAIVVFGLLSYLGWLSPAWLATVFGLILVGVVLYRALTTSAQRHLRSARSRWDDAIKAFHSLALGIKELKLNATRRQEFLSIPFAQALGEWRASVVHGRQLNGAAANFAYLLFFVTIGAYLFIHDNGIVADRRVTTAFVFVIIYLIGPLEGVMGGFRAFDDVSVAYNRIGEIVHNLDPHLSETTDAFPRPAATWSRLELANVRYTYPATGDERAFMFGPLDLTLVPGELVFVAGGNGTGKTTLAKLLTGLYVPASGMIKLDGREIDDDSRGLYRQLFSAIFSDFHLFEHLTRAESVSEPQLSDYIERFGLHEVVRVRGGTLSTTTALSQGQRKRVALLAAFAEDRPIYLFDEWAADQDQTFREVFYRVLLPELKHRGKTVVVISHDESYYDQADRLLKFNNGRLQ